jgi:hypothetical protein
MIGPTIIHDEGSAWFKFAECHKKTIDGLIEFIDTNILGIRQDKETFVCIGGGVFSDTDIAFNRNGTPRYIAAGYNGNYYGRAYTISWGINPKLSCFDLVVERKKSNQKCISAKLVDKINDMLVEYVSN